MPSSEPTPGNNLKEDKASIKNYSKYSSIAFQMVAIIGLFAFIGYKLDAWLGHQVQWITAISCVLGVCLSIYQTIRQLKS